MSTSENSESLVVPASFPEGILSLISNKIPWGMAVFSRQTGLLLHSNRALCSWFDPEHRMIPPGLALTDMLGIECQEDFKNRWLPHLLVFGTWEGGIQLRDLWGSEFSVTAAFCLFDLVTGEQCFAMLACKDAAPGQGRNAGAVSDRELLHALLDSMPGSVYFKDRQGRFLRVNRYKALKHGHENPGFLIGLTDFDLFPIDHAQATYSMEQQIIASGTAVLDMEEKESALGEVDRWVSSSKFPLRDRDGDIVGTFGLSRDITARKKAEAERNSMQLQLQLHSKLESIGRLASGVAHEINTPAQFIMDNLDFIKKSMSPLITYINTCRELAAGLRKGDDAVSLLRRVSELEGEIKLDYLLRELPPTVDDAMEGLTRVSQIVRSLKDFSHTDKTSKTRIDLNRCIETTLSVASHEWKYLAELKYDLAEALPAISGVYDEINQVILSLVTNSCQAIQELQSLRGISEKGTISIRTRAQEGSVVLMIEDTGNGIPHAVQAHVFEPFFSTKEVGKGSGQSLAICHNVIVNKLGGSIAFTSEPGHGTRFTITLPVA